MLLRRQQAAIELLYALQLFSDNLKEITHNPLLYEYDGNYPGLRLEIDQFDSPKFKYRLIRLITNELGSLKKKWVKLVIVIAGKEADELRSVLEELNLNVKNLCNYLGTCLGDHPDRDAILKNYNPEQLLGQIGNIVRKTEIILKNLIH